MYLRLFFVYRGAVSAPLVPCPDPNRDPSAEFGAESAGRENSPPAGAIPVGGTVIFRSIFLKTLFFVYSNAFFEASLFSRCADNLLFTDAKHTDAVFHR